MTKDVNLDAGDRGGHLTLEEMRANIKKLETKVFDFFTLSQIGKSFLALQNTRDIANVLLSAVQETSHAKGAALFLINRDNQRYELMESVGFSSDTGLKEIYFEKEEGLFWQVLKGGEPFMIRESDGSYRFQSIVKKWHFEPLNSALWVPLLSKSEPIGALILTHKANGSGYSDTEITFINQLTKQAAIAMESAMLDSEKTKAKTALDRKMADLSVLYDVSQALNFTNDLKKTLLFILDKAKHRVNAERGSIMLANKQTGMLEISVVRGIDPLQEAKINSGSEECTKIKIGEGVAGRVAATRQPIILNETSEKSIFLQSAKSNVSSIVCMPLIANDDVIGVMNITNKLTGGDFAEDDINFLTTLTNQAAITIYNAQLYNLAITDGMTKLYIRRYFEQKLEEEVHRSERYQHPLSLIMSDVDFFKKFNDTYGHQQGDIVLVQAAHIFKGNLREIDLPCRYGGEEYIIILPETNAEDAKVVAERLRRMIEAYDFPGQKDPLKVTVSLGIASFPQDGKNPQELIRAADTALYAAKKAGRNCSMTYLPGMTPPAD